MTSVDAFLTSLRQAARGLWRDKGFSGTVLAMFALCLAANVLIFSVVDAVLLKPLPFPESEQLVVVFNHYAKFGGGPANSSVPTYFEDRGVSAFADVAALSWSMALVGEAGDRAEPKRSGLES